MNNADYPTGTQFLSWGRNKKLCTVVDKLTTTNRAGDVVQVRYVATHEFCGQTVTNHDVPASSIARGIFALNESIK